MEKLRNLFSGGIRLKIFRTLLITIVLIIAAYTAVFFYQSNKVEQLVNDAYEAQHEFDAANGQEEQEEAFRDSAVANFHKEMFHARNILILLILLIVATGMASAFSIASALIQVVSVVIKRKRTSFGPEAI